MPTHTDNMPNAWKVAAYQLGGGEARTPIIFAAMGLHQQHRLPHLREGLVVGGQPPQVHPEVGIRRLRKNPGVKNSFEKIYFSFFSTDKFLIWPQIEFENLAKSYCHGIRCLSKMWIVTTTALHSWFTTHFFEMLLYFGQKIRPNLLPVNCKARYTELLGREGYPSCRRITVGIFI